MSTDKKEEGPKIINMGVDGKAEQAPSPAPMTQAEQLRQQKARQKQAAVDLADYKKRIRASNEVKELQVQELELGIRFYKAKVEFRELAPKMEELDALEQAEAKEEQEKRKKQYEDYLEAQKKKEEEKEEEKPKIVVPKVGKPRK